MASRLPFARLNAGVMPHSMHMKVVFFLVAPLAIGHAANAAEPDALALLKRYLGRSIEVVSEREIRYCPDNTCDIYRIKDSSRKAYLASFVYLHLFHQSGYIYLSNPAGTARPFRETAKDQESSIRQKVEIFCGEPKKSPACILQGMKRDLSIAVTSWRYDEGKFNES